MTTDELNILFKGDKSDWYVTGSNNTRLWDRDLTNRFWSELKRNKIDKNDYNFVEFNFPSFCESENGKLNRSASYYTKFFGGNDNIIKQNVHFQRCTFSGHCIFQESLPHITSSNERDISFMMNLSFSDCSFQDEFRLQGSKISGDLNVTNCTFEKDFIFNFINVLNNLNIKQCEVVKEFSITGAYISGKSNIRQIHIDSEASIHHSTFNDGLNLSSSIFKSKFDTLYNSYGENSSFSDIELKEKVTLSNDTYNNFVFYNIQFSKFPSSFRELQVIEDKNITFTQCIFPDNFYFLYCSIKHIKFGDSQILKINFVSCEWEEQKGRLILGDENPKYAATKFYVKKLEELYRQFKRNFESSKNWELSGLAYVSEMEMRKKRLLQEKNLFLFSIYAFYGFFGGYTQDIKKPLISLALSFLGFSMIYFFIDYNLINSLERGAKGALPYIQINEKDPFQDYWTLIRNIQFIFSSILISFFILALRKRFKQ